MSTFISTSEFHRINTLAYKEPVNVSEEVFNLIKKCVQLSEITQRAFDITFGSVAIDF